MRTSSNRVNLVVHPGLGQREVREARAEVERCQEKVQHLRAGRERPEGLRGVLASCMVKQGEVIAARWLKDITQKPGNALRATAVYRYRAPGRVAVET